jgi:hypothetical protein
MSAERAVDEATHKQGRVPKDLYLPRYANSWGLLIGINEYAHCSPLGYACNDAQAVASALIGRFGFLAENLEILLNEQATKKAILKALLRHVHVDVANGDDRGLIFFAGHGHTAQGRRGEVGYLVPADGDCDDLSTLMRWDELTRNAELLPAKHVLFIMDACYGGLALARHLHPGSRRFLKDMLCRYSRQVLTAGKADEQVADGDGPRAGNSLFTGHFLDALAGAAASKDGYVTANGVMAYVYDRVAKDQRSHQTPHYGFIDGDGDFIFSQLPVELLEDDPRVGKDVLIDVPAELLDQIGATQPADDIELLKEYLSEPRYRIKLDDFVSTRLRRAAEMLGPDRFPLSSNPQTAVAEFPKRLSAFEKAIRSTERDAIMLGKWATAEQNPVLANMFARLSDGNLGLAAGLSLWIGLRWYPVSFLMYSAGIAAISTANYGSFAVIHTAKVQSLDYKDKGSIELIIPVVDGMLKVQETEIWKKLPGHERHYTPHSEYMFKAVQPALEDMLFLGTSYERMFDRYEIFRALVYADLARHSDEWFPVGRFGWKYTSRFGMRADNPFADLRAEASERGDQWAPLKAGLFGGSYARFNDVVTQVENRLNRLQWR